MQPASEILRQKRQVYTANAARQQRTQFASLTCKGIGCLAAVRRNGLQVAPDRSNEDEGDDERDACRATS